MQRPGVLVLAAVGLTLSVPISVSGATAAPRGKRSANPSAAASPTKSGLAIDEAGVRAMAEFMAQMGKVDDAIAMYDDLITSFPGDGELYAALAPLCAQSPTCESRVVGLWRHAYQLLPDDTSVVEGLQESLIKAGLFDEAAIALRAFVARHPNDDAALHALLEILITAHRQPEALALVQTVPHLDLQTELLRIDLLDDTGHVAEADAAIQSFVATHPTEATGWIRAGEHALDRGDLPAVEKALAQASAKPPTDDDELHSLHTLAKALVSARNERHHEFRVFWLETYFHDTEDDLDERDDY